MNECRFFFYAILGSLWQHECYLRTDHFDSSNIAAAYTYTIFVMQKLKTRVVKRNVNPEWDEKLTLTVSDPNIPVKIFVYDKDTFTFDDKMGDAEFEIATFVKVVQMRLEGLPEGTIIARVQPTRKNCLAEESCIVWSNGKVVQNMVLRLRNVERGEVELQLQWIPIPMGL